MSNLSIEKKIFISTGWPGLDASLNGGLLLKTATAVFARPGTGTSAFVMNLCLNAAAQGCKCLLFTHDGFDLCFAKMLAATAAPDVSIHTALQLWSDTSVVSKEILTALEDLSKLDINVRDIPSTVVELEDVIKEHTDVDDSGCGKPTVIVIDGLDDFDCSPVSFYNCLKQYANSYNAAVVATAHEWRDNDGKSFPTSNNVKMAMERCDTVLSFAQDSDISDVKLSIHKCRYSSPCHDEYAVQLVFMAGFAKIYEIKDVAEYELGVS